MIARFTIPGPPVPKGRPRTFRQGGRTITTTPARTRLYESHVAWVCLAQHHARFGAQRVSVELAFYLATHRACDLDNLIKSVTDPMIGLCLDDDSQIDRLVAERHHDKANPRVEVEIRSMEAA